MTFTEHIIKQLSTKKTIKRILLIDGSDKRAEEAATMHVNDGHVVPVMLFKTAADKPAGYKGEFIVIEDWKSKEQLLIDTYVEIRKGKENAEQALKVIYNPPFFAMLMIRLNEVDGVVGGLINPTSDILRAAFKVIGPKPGIKTISSVMVMEKGDDWSIFADISVNIMPNEDQLVDIAVNAAEFGKSVGFESKVAFLSFSTSGSAVHERSLLSANAAKKFNETYKADYPAVGEIQFDAALSQEVRSMKYKGESFDGKASILVFPSLESGNIGYKIAQRMGGYGAIGPIITGVNKPVNDLSRGATPIDVYNTILLTAIQVED